MIAAAVRTGDLDRGRRAQQRRGAAIEIGTTA
jgi:hypothetical protein